MIIDVNRSNRSTGPERPLGDAQAPNSTTPPATTENPGEWRTGRLAAKYTLDDVKPYYRRALDMYIHHPWPMTPEAWADLDKQYLSPIGGSEPTDADAMGAAILAPVFEQIEMESKSHAKAARMATLLTDVYHWQEAIEAEQADRSEAQRRADALIGKYTDDSSKRVITDILQGLIDALFA